MITENLVTAHEGIVTLDGQKAICQGKTSGLLIQMAI